MQANAFGTVVPLESRSNNKSVSLESLDVIIKSVAHSEGDDCVFCECLYPAGVIKHHQLFFVEPTSRLLELMVQTYRNIFNRAVVPEGKLPEIKDLPGIVVKFKESV